MFCPNCGKANQEVKSYCRQCGTFLPDFDELQKKEITPENHLLANTVLNVMSGVVSVALAIWLYIFILGDKNPPPFVIYITAGFLTAMFFWQTQVFWRNLQLKKQISQQRKFGNDSEFYKGIKLAKTEKFLNEADFENVIPASVAEYTTKNLKEKINRSS